MVVCGVKSSSFGLIFLLITVLKLCVFSETSKEYEDSCSADIYNSRFRFCPKGRRSMDDMGNIVEKSSCGAKEKESSNEADKSPAEMPPESKSKKEDGTETQGKIFLDHAFREVDDKHVLHNVKTGRRFEFNVFNGDRAKNQQRYEELGEAITEYVYEYLEMDLGLEKVTIPVRPKEKDPKGFFFMSKNALEAEKLMILIHGSGVVRAGQWARSLIINDSFETGTMVPYIERARREGYGVLITNGNHNYDEEKRKRIKVSKNPQEHFVYVWKKFIKNAKAKDIVIVAHSFGGVVVQYGLRNIQEAMERIKAVAFTDSVHSVGYGESSQIKRWFKQKTRNWVSSAEDLDTPIRPYYGEDSGVLVSAGTTEHVWTSHCAEESVFKFFKEKLAEGEKSGEDNMENKDNNENEGLNLDRKVEDEQGEEKPQETDQEKFATDGYPVKKSSPNEVDEMEMEEEETEEEETEEEETEEML